MLISRKQCMRRRSRFSSRSMDAFENLQFESEVYFKLREAEREAKLTDKRYSSKEVLKAMRDAIGGEQVV